MVHRKENNRRRNVSFAAALRNRRAPEKIHRRCRQENKTIQRLAAQMRARISRIETAVKPISPNENQNKKPSCLIVSVLADAHKTQTKEKRNKQNTWIRSKIAMIFRDVWGKLFSAQRDERWQSEYCSVFALPATFQIFNILPTRRADEKWWAGIGTEQQKKNLRG